MILVLGLLDTSPFSTSFVGVAGMFYLTLALLHGRPGSRLDLLEPLLLLGSVSLLSLALWYGLYLEPVSQVGAVLSLSVLLWYPVLYLVAFLTFPQGVALRYSLGMLALLMALTLPHALTTIGDGGLTDGLMLPFQAYMANGVTIAVLRFLAGFQRRLERMEGVAEAMRELAHTDALTGAANRRQIEVLLTQEYRRAERYGRPFSFMMIDIDDFKHFNDTLGHAVGDEILVDLAKRLRRKVRVSDTVGRWGGEEFVILAPETSLDDALRLAELVRGYIGAHPLAASHGVTISVGVAAYRRRDDLDSLVERADAALYLAKNSGKNLVQSELDLPKTTFSPKVQPQV